MSVSVSMPQLGESVTEGTVTRWLKREGDHVLADEPLLEVSTDKVDTEIPSPVSGILRGITVAEDETVAVGAQLAIIDEDGAPAAADAAPTGQAAAPTAPYADPTAPYADPTAPYPPRSYAEQAAPSYAPPSYAPRSYVPPSYAEPAAPSYPPPSYTEPTQAEPTSHAPRASATTSYVPSSYAEPMPPAYAEPAYAEPAPAQPPPAQPSPAQPPAAEPGTPAIAASSATVSATTGSATTGPQADGDQNPYVTPLVRKLAAEHQIDLATIAGTGVGGRIRKQDVIDAASRQRGEAAPVLTPGPGPVVATARPQPGPVTPAPPVAPAPSPAVARPTPAPALAATAVPDARPATPASGLRGTTQQLSRARQVIAQRMVESLQTSAQLTTVVEADVTALAKLRDQAKASFEAREGVKLSFLPFFALAAVEALKAHPKLNASIDTASGTVTYHDAEHLGIAVDTDRGLMVPVIRNAGDLNIGGLARKIADLAQRTRAGQVSPDDLTGGTFTLTNTGSRGALFDTPIINQPQVAILGTGTVNRRAVVVADPALGEVIAVRSVVYLALTYDHRLVDGADAARFLVTVKSRLEQGAFEAEFGQ